MTAPRRDGGGSPFGEWVRDNKYLDSRVKCLCLADIDWLFHKFSVRGDRMGERDLQAMMDVELKTFSAPLKYSQRETLFFRHQQLYDRRKKLLTLRGKKVSVWSFGVNILSLAGAAPVEGESMRWGIFDVTTGEIVWTVIESIRMLEEILCFERRPDRPAEHFKARRHHAKKTLLVTVKTDLGFPIEEMKTYRS